MPVGVHFTKFNVHPTTKTALFPVVPKMKMPLFSNAAKVYYKKGSLAAGGIGTVRNSGAKSRKI